MRSETRHHNHLNHPVMNRLTAAIFVLTIFGEISCNCGCLKCSKHLQVISPPYFPYQVIVNRGSSLEGGSPLPNPIVPPYIPIDYQMSNFNPNCEPVYAYKYTLQTLAPPPPPPAPLTGLFTKADRVILHSSDCPVYTGHDCDSYNPAYASIFQNGVLRNKVVQPGPILQPLTDETFKNAACGCRYDHGKRKKRDIPIIQKGLNFLVELLPRFLRFPFEHTLNSLTYHQRRAKPSKSLLQKLRRLNRGKRSLVFGGEGISLPFLRVTDVENSLEEGDGEEESEVVGGSRTDAREEFLKPLNFGHIFPHNPIFYLLNTPIRLLHHFHQLGRQISPVFKSVPHVLVNSKKYLRNLGKNFKNDVLNIASDLIGNFDDVHAHRYKPLRYKRSLEQYEPEYSLTFDNKTETKSRKRRYILKVVDEDEVEEFLREKLGGFVESTERPKKKKEKETNKKKLVVERLSPRLIIDNNGRPFLEINGVKRPLFLNRKTTKNSEEKNESKEETLEDIKEKINNIITQAKERINQNPTLSTRHALPQELIKERINQILSEIQNLINLDFDKYSNIYDDLCKLENFKDVLVKGWKKTLIEDRSNDIASKIRLLDDFKEIQILRDKAVENIVKILSSGSNFITKKLTKMLVRLQKLQCVIYRMVEDFGEKIRMSTDFDVKKEIRYVDFLTNLRFVDGQSKHELENQLRQERDSVLESEMKTLDGLRKLLEKNEDKPEKMYEEAHLLWEVKNIDKLQKDAISEMNEKISRGQKVRKELKILFDLQRQSESCEEKQKKLLKENNDEEMQSTNEEGRQTLSYVNNDKNHNNNNNNNNNNKNNKYRIYQNRLAKHRYVNTNRNRNFPQKTIIEDKKPIKLVSNGYTMTAYKVSDGFP